MLVETPSGAKASLSQGVFDKDVFLAQRLVPRAVASRPITSIRLVDRAGGEGLPPGYEAVDRTISGERTTLDRQLCVSRDPAAAGRQPDGQTNKQTDGRHGNKTVFLE